MAGIVWSGTSPEKLIAQFRLAEEALTYRAHVAMDKTVTEAAADQAQILEDAHTRTGLARASAGGFPGRHLTGHMIEEIDHDTQIEYGNGQNTIVGEWGWDNLEEYFAAQDLGTETIPAASSLHTSFIAAEQRLIERIAKL